MTLEFADVYLKIIFEPDVCSTWSLKITVVEKGALEQSLGPLNCFHMIYVFKTQFSHFSKELASSWGQQNNETKQCV